MPARSASTALVVTSLLLLAGCGDDDATTTNTTVADEPAVDPDGSTTTAPDTETSETTAVTAPAGEVVELSYAGGEVAGGGRRTVPLGSVVTLRVTSDVADHVHLHGYDLMIELVPGTASELTFEATIPGVFEVELEDRGILLGNLEVS